MPNFSRSLLVVALFGALALAACSKGGKTADGDMSMGDPNAKVKMVEYASASCSHCARVSHKSNLVQVRQVIVFVALVGAVFKLGPQCLLLCLFNGRFVLCLVRVALQIEVRDGGEVVVLLPHVVEGDGSHRCAPVRSAGPSRAHASCRRGGPGRAPYVVGRGGGSS